MDEAHFRPPRPARTARVLALLAGVALIGGVAGGFRLGWIAVVVGAVVAAALAIVASRLSHVELVLRPSGIEVVDITGRRRQAWVGTQRLLIDFARPRPLLEIDAPGPAEPYRSTLVLAGLETDEHAEARARLEDLLGTWAGPNVRCEIRHPGDAGSGSAGTPDEVG